MPSMNASVESVTDQVTLSCTHVGCPPSVIGSSSSISASPFQDTFVSFWSRLQFMFLKFKIMVLSITQLPHTTTKSLQPGFHQTWSLPRSGFSMQELEGVSTLEKSARVFRMAWHTLARTLPINVLQANLPFFGWIVSRLENYSRVEVRTD